MRIAILDYDMANLRSVQKGFEAVGARADIIRDPARVKDYDKLVLPGVGAFKDAIATLNSRGLSEPIKAHIAKQKPFLGICLGLQLLFETGYEDGTHKGLGVFKGDCVRFDVDEKFKLKVPHMGWNQLQFNSQNPCPIFREIPEGSSVYFVHGYYVVPKDESLIATTTDYGRPFVSSIHNGNLFATQFHPEKSQKVGLQILS